MIMDTQETFSLAQTLVVGTGDTVSTNVYDSQGVTTFPAQNIDAGVGEEVYLNVRIGTAVTTAASGTLQLVLQVDDNVAFSSPKEFVLTGALAVAVLTANTFIYQGRIPVGMERFWRVVYRVGTGALTAGTVDAFLTKDIQANRSYASGFTVA